MPPEEAKIFVVDSVEDLGIDGIYFNNFTKTLHPNYSPVICFRVAGMV